MMCHQYRTDQTRKPWQGKSSTPKRLLLLMQDITFNTKICKDQTKYQRSNASLTCLGPFSQTALLLWGPSENIFPNTGFYLIYNTMIPQFDKQSQTQKLQFTVLKIPLRIDSYFSRSLSRRKLLIFLLIFLWKELTVLLHLLSSDITELCLENRSQ